MQPDLEVRPTRADSFRHPSPGMADNYVRLRRQGNVLTGYVGATNGGWQQIASVTLPMNQSVLIGLAVWVHGRVTNRAAREEARVNHWRGPLAPGRSP